MPSSPSHAQTGRFRWTICALIFAATTINYMDRQILGLLAPTLQAEIGWSEVQYGNIVTAFQAAYAIGLFVFGWIIDRIGTRQGYVLSIFFWSAAAVGHALARSVLGFGVARFALGFGEAGNFPAAIKAVSEWFPRRERALATGLFNSGANVGAIIAPLFVPWATLHFGWRASFIILGMFGFFWVAWWYRFYTAPEQSRHLSAAEREYIFSDPPEPVLDKIPCSKLIRFPQTWAFVVGISLTGPVWWFYLYWLPKFLHKQYGLDLGSLGLPLVIIYSMACVGSIGGGWLSSSLLRRGWSLNASRKSAMLTCAICVLPVVFAAKCSSLWVSTMLVGLAAAAHQGWAANLYTLVSDLFPKQAVASVVGLGSMFSALAGMAFAQSTGFILERTGSYWTLFVMVGGAYLFALCLMHWLAPGWQPVQMALGGKIKSRTMNA